MRKTLSVASLTLFSLASIASAQTVNLSQTTVTLSATVGSTTKVVSQPINVTSTSGSTVSYNVSPNIYWLSVATTANSTPQPALSFQTTPGSFVIFADPTGLPAGQNNGIVTVLSGGISTNITVNFFISTIGVSPQPPVTFTYVQGSGSLPQPVNLQLTGSATQYSTQIQNSSNCGWLALLPPTGGSVPGFITVTTNASQLAALTPNNYSCSFTITPANSPTTPLTIQVNLTVAATPTVTVTPSAINMNFQNGTAVYPSQLLTLTSNGISSVAYALSAVSTDPGYSGALWFSLSKSSGTLIPAGSQNSNNNTDTVTVQYNSAVSLAAGTYHGQITVTANNTSQNIPVTLLVSNSPLLNVSPSTVSFTAELGGSAPAPATVQVTATSGTPAINVTTSNNTPWLLYSVGSTTASGTPVTISVNPAGLTLGTYKGTLSISGSTTSNNPQTVAVTLTVANDPLISTNVSTSSPLIFAYQTSGAIPPVQTITVNSTTGATLNYAATAANTTASGCANWITLSGNTTSSTTGSFTVSANPSGVSASTTGPACTGTITITATNPSTGAAAPNSPYVIPVNLYVTSTPLLVLTPFAAPAFTAQVGLSNSAVSQNCTTNGSTLCNLTLTSTSSTDLLTITVSTSTSDGSTWLYAVPTNATIPLNGSVALTIGLVFIPQTAGSYSGVVKITATAADGAAVLDSPLNIPVTLQVTAGAPTANPTSLSFTQTLGGTAPPTQTISVGSSTGTSLNFTASATSSTSSPWLSVTPTSGTTPGTVTVTANGSNLQASTTPYTGQITIAAAGSANVVNVPVTLTVNAGTIAATPTSLTFTQAAGGSAPTAQSISVTGTPGTLSFTTSVATTSGGNNWLAATPASGSTPGSVSVTASAGNLGVGQYNGTVTITSTGATGSPISIPVTLNVVAPQTISVSPTTLNFSAIVGQPSPSAQTASVTSSGSGTPFSATAAAANNGTWLSVSPTSGVTPAQLTVTVASQSLAAGNYSGTITITSPNSANPVTLTVNLTVASIPTPVIAAVKNAASYAVGGVAPGENIVIGGTGIGPATLTGLVVNGNGTIATTVANTQILFDGIPAPIIYVSATQSSVMVPYEIAGRATTNMTVVYQGVPSVAVPYNVLSVLPGIYTQNASGTGPGSILNQNYSVNGPGNPAAVGSVVAVYMTGEGVTNPASPTGGVAPGNGTGLNKPVVAVTATVAGIPATVNYYGSAPDEVYGVMQVNLTIPPGVPAGAQPVVISVGGIQTQTGVTVSVASSGTAEEQ